MPDLLLDSEFLKKLEYLSLVARRVHRGRSRGEHVSFRKGASLEFFDYRRYRPGDDFRYIDWNLYRRLGKVFLKLFTAEEDLTVHVLVDTSTSMEYGSPPKIDYAAKLAAALGYIASVNLDRVGVSMFSDGHTSGRPPSGRGSTPELFSFLENLQPSGETEFNRSLKEYASRTRQTGLIAVITDLMDPAGWQDGLLALKYRGFEIVLIHILADDDLRPGLSGPCRLVDSETGGTVRITADRRLLQAYHLHLDTWLKDIESFTLSRGIEYLRASVSVPFEDLVLKYLRQGLYLH